MFKRYISPLLLIWLLFCVSIPLARAADITITTENNSFSRIPDVVRAAPPTQGLTMSGLTVTEQVHCTPHNCRAGLLDASSVGPLPETMAVILLSIITLVVTRRRQ